MKLGMQQFIEEAYRAFSGYSLGSPLTVCRCGVCVDEATENELVSLPLRELSPALLYEYNNSCHDRRDPQAQREFRYFLPRYFELIAVGKGDELFPDHHDTPFYRLKATNWFREWPPNEIDLINRFFVHLLIDSTSDIESSWYFANTFDVVKKRWQLRTDITEVIELATDAGGDVTGIIETLLNTPGAKPTLALANYCIRNLSDMPLGPDWLVQAPIADRLESAFFEVASEREQQVLSDGHRILSRLMKAKKPSRP